MSQPSPSGPPPAALQDFPIWQGVVEAYRRTFAALPHFVVAAALPAILTFILNIFSIRIALNAMAAPEHGNPFALIVLILVGNCPYILFAVAWFRLVLLGEAQARPVFFSGWKQRHWQFLRYVFAMLGIAMFAGMAATMVLSLIFSLIYGADILVGEEGIGSGLFFIAFLASLAILILLLRFCFVFPATAVDETYEMAMSWRHTKGQAVRLFIAALLVAAPFGVLTSLIGSLFGGAVEVGGIEEGTGDALSQSTLSFTYFILEAIFVALGYLMTAVFVQLIGLAFQTCTGWVPDDNE